MVPSPLRMPFICATALAASVLIGCASPTPLAPPAPVQQGDFAAVWRHVQQAADAGLRAAPVAGLSIAVVNDQGVLWSYGAGWADAQARVPAADQTVYRMGSISKLLTVTAALQLAQQGRLALDAPVQQVLPEWQVVPAPGHAPITPRQLMTHHAGLVRDVGEGMWGPSVGRFQDMVQALGPQAQMMPVGQALSYSNVGMTVLGTAVERAAGQPFEAHLQRTLLQPLGMQTASFTQAPTPTMARGHQAGKAADEHAMRDTPAGGLNASVLDMGRFMAMVLAGGTTPTGHTVLSPALLADMVRSQNENHPLDMDVHIGLGWMVGGFGQPRMPGAGPLLHHSGATPHFRAHMALLPQHKLGVVVAANDARADALVHALAQQALQMALQAQTGLPPAPPAPAWAAAPTPLDAATQSAWVGDYATPLGHARVLRDGQRLKVQAGDVRLELVPTTTGDMGLRYRLLGLIALPFPDLAGVTLRRDTVQGREVLIAQSQGQTMLLGERLPAATADATAACAAPWAGRYQPAHPSPYAPVAHIQVRQDGGVLLAQVQASEAEGGQREVWPLACQGPTQVRVLRLLADGGETVQGTRAMGAAPDAPIDGFTVSGIRFVRAPAVETSQQLLSIQ